MIRRPRVMASPRTERIDVRAAGHVRKNYSRIRVSDRVPKLVSHCLGFEKDEIKAEAWIGLEEGGVRRTQAVDRQQSRSC